MKYNERARHVHLKRAPGWQAHPRWRVTHGGEIALGPGKADLLEAIGRSGSISAAAASLGMSYRRAWLLVGTMNRCFLRPLVATSSHRRRGATLTSDGRLVLRLYRRMQSRSRSAVQSDLAALLRLLRHEIRETPGQELGGGWGREPRGREGVPGRASGHSRRRPRRSTVA